jgi:hypothetical protein
MDLANKNKQLHSEIFRLENELMAYQQRLA